MPFLPSPLQLMENGFPSVHFSRWCTEKSHRLLNPRIWRMFKYSNTFIWKKLLEQKGVVSWGIVQTLFFQMFGRFFRKICRTVSLLIPTMSAIILMLRRWSCWTISLIFWMFWSVFEVEGRPGCSSPSTSSRLSLDHSNTREHDNKLSPTHPLIM